MLVRTQLFRILQEEGLERVSVLGLPFDPRSAQAVQRRTVTQSDQDGLVIEELQGGHQLRGHVIRRAKVVVGEYAEAPVVEAAMPSIEDDFSEPTIVMHTPDFSEPPPVEPTVGMPALPAPESTPAAAEPPPLPPPGRPKRRMSTPSRATPAPTPTETPKPPPPAEEIAAKPIVPPPVPVPPPLPPPPAPPPAAAAEEPIVVEDWTEPPPAETPAPKVAPAVTPPAPPRRTTRPAAPLPPPPDDEDDGSANATMVLGDSSLLMRPTPTPTPASIPAPVPVTRGASAPAAAGKADWERAEPPPRKDPKETQSVAREPPPPASSPAAPPPTPQPVAARPPARPPAPPPPTPPARVRTGGVGAPPRVRTPVYEDVPTSPNEPAVRPPAFTNPPEVAPPPASRAGLYAGIGAGLVVLAVAAAVLVSHLRQRARATVAPPTTLAQVVEASPAAVAPPPVEIPEEITVVTTPPAVTTPLPGASPVAATTATTLPAPSPAPSAKPVRPTPPPRAANPPPVTQPPAPVNPVPALLAQAEHAMAARRYDEAIARFSDVLKADPQNAEAIAGRQQAMGERASAGRYFFTAVTVSEGKASGGGIKGFDGGQVVKSQCECALTYEVTPANPVQGQLYSVAIFLKNDSKKDIKPQSLAVSVTVNGSSASRSVGLAAKEVPRGKKVMVGKLEETWRVGTTSWSLEAAVGAGGNTYRTQLTWELRVPSGQ